MLILVTTAISSSASSSSDSPTTNASHKSTVVYIHIVTVAATPYNSYVRVDSTTTGGTVEREGVSGVGGSYNFFFVITFISRVRWAPYHTGYLA